MIWNSIWKNQQVVRIACSLTIVCISFVMVMKGGREQSKEYTTKHARQIGPEDLSQDFSKKF